MLHQPHDLIPPTQTFEIEITWLYQRYKHRIPKNDPLKNSHHALPKALLDYITTSFNITHSYFSSPVTCSTHLTKFFSPFPRDKFFGSLGTAFSHRWQGIGYAHPHNETEAQTTIHWARLAAKHDPNTITILTIPYINWYQNPTPYIGPFPDTHVITHIPAYTTKYEEPTKPPELNEPRIEPLAIRILCVHHQNNNIGTIEQMDTIKNICNNLNITRTITQIAPPTPQNIEVNKSKTWNALTYSSPNTHYHNTIPPIPNYENETPLKFSPQYCFYTDGSFNPPKKVGDIWLREEAGYGIYNQEKNIKLAIRLPGLQNIFRA